jgi:CHAT domain-containing protein
VIVTAVAAGAWLLTRLFEDDLTRAWGLLDRGRARQALMIFDRVAAGAAPVTANPRQAEALIGRARCLVRIGDYPRFGKLAAELAAASAVRQSKRLQMLLHYVEAAWVDREPSRALPALSAGLACARELHDTKFEGRLTGCLGIYYYYAGDASKATLILDALKMAIKSGDEVYVLRWGMIVAIGLADMGHPERALDLMKLGLLLGRSIGDDQDRQVIYGYMASVYTKLGRTDEARRSFEEGIRIAREIQDPAGEALLLTSRAQIRMAGRDYRGAIDDLVTARRKNKEIYFERGESECLGYLAEAYAGAGLLADAVNAATEAIDIDRRFGQVLMLPKHIQMLARAQLGMGQRAVAMENYDRAARLVYTARMATPNDDLRSGFLGEYSGLYREYLELLLATGTADARRKAFDVLEMYRGRAMADALAQAAIPGSDPSTDPLVAKSREVNRAIAVSEGSLAGMADNPKKVQEALRMAEHVAELRSVEREIRARNPAYAVAGYPEPVTVDQVAAVLKPEEALLSYSLGPQQSYLFIVTKESFSVAVLPDEKTIASLAADFRNLAARRQGADERVVTRSLYDTLVLPAAAVLVGRTTVNVVPDGILNLLPFEAFRAPDGTFLVERFVFVYNSSATVLAYLRGHPIKETAPKMLLALGSPIYPADEPLLPAAERSGNSSAGLLPFSGLEVTNIIREIGGSGDALLGADASVTKLLSLDLGGYRMIHFAVHAAVNSNRPEASALVLSTDQGGNYGHHLYPRDIVRTRLNANLVTLSACDTGLGKLQGGEGVINMTRAFFYAGAHAVVASLWYVEDAATAQLMAAFYRYIHDGNSLADALRQANSRFGTSEARR